MFVSTPYKSLVKRSPLKTQTAKEDQKPMINQIRHISEYYIRSTQITPTFNEFDCNKCQTLQKIQNEFIG